MPLIQSPSAYRVSVQSGNEVKSHDKAVSRLRINGGDLRQMLAVGAALLEENVEQVNALNVFPVPDGDTGTNMLLTMQSALEEVARVTGDDVSVVAHAAAHGSLMGARGNSGVILSQLLRGIAKSADGKQTLDGSEFAAALKEGAATAYRGIGKPVEGTILTVAREAAEAGVLASQLDRSVTEVLASVVQAGDRSLRNTPNLLSTLKEAGVVDAGGQGYLLVLQGALMFITGERTGAVLSETPRLPAMVRPVGVPTGEDYGYCTELLIRGEQLPLEEMRLRFEAIGSSVIVVGEPETIHLHVHTQRPGDVLNLAVGFGFLDKIKIENMQIQHTSYLSARGGEAPRKDGVAVVTVASGPGLAEIFRDLGAVAVVPGGQTMNPSIEELVHAAASTGYARVILLPNNPNVVMTAQQAQSLARVELKVVPTRTVCEGIAAMIAFTRDGALETNVESMTEAASLVQTIELTRAVRSTRSNGLQIEEGQAIGLLNGTLVEAGGTMEEVALRVLDRAKVSEHEMVTVYRGDESTEEKGEALAAAIRRVAPDAQVEVVEGGQPHYPFIISVE